MKVVLTCFEPSQSFGPMTRLQPAALLPVLNKPLLQRQIEDCVSSGLRDIHIAVVDHPISIRRFVGDGARWGVTVKVWTFKEPCTGLEIVSRLSSQLDGPVLVVPVEQCLDFALDDLISFHGSHGQNVSRVMSAKKLETASRFDGKSVPVNFVKLTEPEDSGIFILDSLANSLQDAKEIIISGGWAPIDSPKSLWAANLACMEGFFPLLTGELNTQQATGVRSGHHTAVDGSSIVTGPAFIGDFTIVRAKANIGPYAVIGNNSIIDAEALVRSSVIFNDVYVGTQTNLENVIAVGNMVMNIKLGTWVTVPDRFLVSNVKDKIFVPWTTSLFSKIVAAALLALTSPVWLTKGLFRKASGKPFFTKGSSLDLNHIEGTDGFDTIVNPSVWSFGKSNGLVSRLPGLIDVIKGRIALVGVRHVQELEGSMYAEDWARQRFESSVGLFTPVDAEAINNASEEEKIIVENLYVASRTFKQDMKVLVKSVWNLMLGRG